MKRWLILALVLLILVAIPATVFVVMKNQELRKKAAPATTLSFLPANINKKVGDEFNLEARIDTGGNQVVAAEINLVYDPTKLEAVSITNGALFPNILASGVVGQGSASITVGAANAATPVTGTGVAAIIKFRAIEATTSPVSVRYSANSFVGALGEGSTNVLVGTTPATVTVTGSAAQPTPTPTLNLSLTPTPTATQSGSASSSAVQILSPIDNESVSEDQPVITGKAPPGATVTITIYSDPITVTVMADAYGNWKYQLAEILSTGPHTLVVAAEDPQTGQVHNATIDFVVAAGGTGETQSGTPVAGTIETTLLLLGAGILLIVVGATLPAFTKIHL